MISITTSGRTIGVNFNDKGEAEVSVWAPEAKKVELLSARHTLPLAKAEYGYWELVTSALKPGDPYHFAVDGKEQRPDPASLSQPEGVHGPSQAFDLKAFSWTDQSWANYPLEEYLLYELHTGTFTPEGTFEALEQKLDYLLELGVTAIELMPVAQFPGSRNWGYDGVFPYAVQYSYGGAAGLQQLVNRCHEKGIAVVLDVVYNHLGPEGNYLGEYGKYFTDKYHTPWGGAVNFDDAWCDGVRRYFIENVLMWFRDFHIDALRMDAVHAIKDFGPVHILKDIRKYVDQLMAETGRKHYLIVEMDLNDNRYIAPVERGGYGMDAQWVDEFHHALRVTSGEERNGYYADFNGIEHLAKAYNDTYVYDGQFSAHRKRFFGTKVESTLGQQFVVFSQNHDHIGNRMLGERTSQLLSFEMQKLVAGAVLLSPYLPMLFMGEEWSEPHPFLYFVSHTDPELVEAVRKGRKAEFAAFHLEGEAPDPVAETTYQDSKLQWELLGQEPHQTMFRYYQQLIRLRKEQPALRCLSREQLSAEANKAQQTLELRRWDAGQRALCLLNFSDQPQTMALPTEETSWRKLLYSAETPWGGPEQPNDQLLAGSSVTVQAQSLLICTNHYV
ncbi:malto-oligosyltrehalose trehalohydrolase [Rhabdobacter roseus]|uniref:Malto-oligosyltrehalose trehalohydrolase n=1 Tax=Rhabdobacter roseus TaxID=1655419 RepID=A0A840TUN2_9BACT|nr:malto-oligosyltrehalose trehalohydrolase [Rhabdobacter roseus]MBB5286615.1 maltooligosyltrehalose trehalohydrolase [Rhabdobacter roseus]